MMSLLYPKCMSVAVIWIFLFIRATGSPLTTDSIKSIRFEHINAGLSQSTVTCILQDRRGFMWFGTKDGLNRYDGIEFTIFKSNTESLLSHSYITCIFEDSEGTLWVGTLEGGLNRYDKNTETFTRFQHDEGNPNSISHNYITCLYEDRNKRLWVGTENGFNLLLPDKSSFLSYRYERDNPWSLSDNNIGVIFEDSKFNLWLGTRGGGLERFDPVGQRFTHYKYNKEDPSSISDNVVRACYKDSEGTIWLGTSDGLNRFIETPNGARFERFQQDSPPLHNSLQNNTITSISEDLYGRLWIGTQINGLYVYDKKKKIFSNFFPNTLDQYSISSNSLWSIYRDNVGTMWLGARNRGLDKWDIGRQKFTRHNITSSGNYALSNRDVACFVEDELGNLWIGTDGGGLSYFNRKTNSYTNYVHDPKDSRSLGSNAVLSLLIDRHHNLWIGTWGGGLNLFDRKTNTFKHYLHNPSKRGSIAGNNVFSLCEDRQGRLWVGVFYGGVSLYDPDSDGFFRYNYNPNDPSSLCNNKVTKIVEDSKGTIWIGTDGGGLDRLHWGGSHHVWFTHYQYTGKHQGELSSNIINTITEDRSQRLWIGTGQGLNRLNPHDGTFDIYKKKDGLLDDIINGILEDEEGFLWLSTNQGVSKFDIQSGKFRNYSTADGLQAEEFIRGSSFKTSSGEFFFGGVNGFNSFFPKNIVDHPYTFFPLYLTEFKIRNEIIKPKQGNKLLATHISETKKITLPYHSNDFSFSFTSLNYSLTTKSRYAYKLEGYDKEWQYVETRRNANYSKVPPGNYIFRVRSYHHDNFLNKSEASIQITIMPPWWKTWWAYSLYGLALAGTLVWYRHLLVKRIRLENDLKMEHLELTKVQEIERLKSNFFATISHEFRTPLTLLLAPLRDLYQGCFQGDSKAQYGMMIRNAERLLRLINQLLDLSKLDSGNMKLEASHLELISFLKPIFSSFESYTQRQGIAYLFQHPKDPLFVYFDPDKLEKIVTNLLFNACKFTTSGSVTLSVQSTDQEIAIKVSDTGIGIPKDLMDHIFDHFYRVTNHFHPVNEEGTGIGLSLVKELVELHRGRIEVNSRMDQGSSFTVFLLLGSGHLQPKEVIHHEPQQFDWGSISRDRDAIVATADDSPALDHQEVMDDGLPLILLIEDNTDMRRYLRDRLQRQYRVMEAADGAEGVRFAMENMPDLIISDILMPKMNGNELCHTLKNNIQTSHIPIILLTAQATSESKIKGLMTGADDYVSKPFNSDELEVRVTNLIKSREALRALFANNNRLTLEPKEVIITPLDEIFMKKVLESIESNIADSEYRIDNLGKDMCMSRMSLYKKIKALTGQTAVEFVRTIRLKRAAQLLRQQQLTISEVTYEVGFNDLQYFRTCFKKQFGVSPSEYTRMHMEQIS